MLLKGNKIKKLAGNKKITILFPENWPVSIIDKKIKYYHSG